MTKLNDDAVDVPAELETYSVGQLTNAALLAAVKARAPTNIVDALLDARREIEEPKGPFPGGDVH